MSGLVDKGFGTKFIYEAVALLGMEPDIYDVVCLISSWLIQH